MLRLYENDEYEKMDEKRKRRMKKLDWREDLKRIKIIYNERMEKVEELSEKSSNMYDERTFREGLTYPQIEKWENIYFIPTFKERYYMKKELEIRRLLEQETMKTKLERNKFSLNDGLIKEYCKSTTKEQCLLDKRKENKYLPCKKLHFHPIHRPTTDSQLGDCSFLNTCFHKLICKYLHYQIDYDRHRDESAIPRITSNSIIRTSRIKKEPLLPQWIQCDLRTLDVSILGKFEIIMADPPWDIHMQLPYGTMNDTEMISLQVPKLQDEGYIFLWVTGRAMELGRDCLAKWGYKICNEIVWIKTNQLQKIIRTGRTGHWLNHGKEHCLIGVKGDPGADKFHHGLDCDVIVAEVRATSHKPDEIYAIAERLAPGGRKLELFGRQHNIKPNWFTLGNQLDGVHIVDLDIGKRYLERYGHVSAMEETEKLQKEKGEDVPARQERYESMINSQFIKDDGQNKSKDVDDINVGNNGHKIHNSNPNYHTYHRSIADYHYNKSGNDYHHNSNTSSQHHNNHHHHYYNKNNKQSTDYHYYNHNYKDKRTRY
ncbi:hypothetical protein SNEBB_009730 [Seison nebaliae]|nr:hypothetical protein SNEBB_009730 [Seison nebaliae]